MVLRLLPTVRRLVGWDWFRNFSATSMHDVFLRGHSRTLSSNVGYETTVLALNAAWTRLTTTYAAC